MLKSPSGFRAVYTRGRVYMGGPRTRVRAYTCVYIDRGVPAPRNGRGRRECWRAATRRLRPCGGSSSLPLRSSTADRGGGVPPQLLATAASRRWCDEDRDAGLIALGGERWGESRGTFSYQPLGDNERS